MRRVGAAILYRVFWPLRWHLSRGLNELKEQAMWLAKGRTF